MANWFSRNWQNSKKRRQLHRRILEALREVGVLLIAFAPLDVVLKGGKELQWGAMLSFFLVGLSAFALGSIAEWRFDDDD